MVAERLDRSQNIKVSEIKRKINIINHEYIVICSGVIPLATEVVTCKKKKSSCHLCTLPLLANFNFLC